MDDANKRELAVYKLLQLETAKYGVNLIKEFLVKKGGTGNLVKSVYNR